MVTLSEFVRSALIARFPSLARAHDCSLPPCDPVDGARPDQNRRQIGFLFFGRIMAYKGLPLFVGGLRTAARPGRSSALAWPAKDLSGTWPAGLRR